MATRDEYAIDTVEIIGHTDGQPNQGSGSNLDTLLEQVVATNTLNRLTPGSNADLGLMRALAIANELRKAQAKQPKLAGLKFRAYSAGQLYWLNGQLAPVNRNPDVSRRRSEVRFTCMGSTETARSTNCQPRDHWSRQLLPLWGASQPHLDSGQGWGVVAEFLLGKWHGVPRIAAQAPHSKPVGG